MAGAMMKFWRVVAAAALVAALKWGVAPALAQEVRRPNIVLIVSDDHGVDALGAYGAQQARTPHLDRLARDGVRFSRAFATTASCSPSRAVLLSGLQAHANGMYGLQHGVHHMQSFDTVRSLPPRLSAAGYLTARIGKFHLAPESVYAFDEILAPEPAFEGSRSVVEMAEAAGEFIRQVRGPFFLYFATTDTHRSPPHVTDRANAFGNRDEGYPGVREERSDPALVTLPSWVPDTPAMRAEWAQYLQSAARLDQGVGRLIDVLTGSGKLSETMIIYLSDNGPPFAGAKTTLYEPGIRLPLIVSGPSISDRGGVREAMVSLVDIAPTILDFASASFSPEEFQGRSFRNVLEHGDASGWDRVYASHAFHEIQMYYPMRAVRTDRYKLIWNIAAPLTFPWARISTCRRAVRRY
jgi:N-sulfoglucosamine sulfohydrolase